MRVRGCMLKLVLDITVPVLVIVMMGVVGMELTVEDFRRVAWQPGLVAAATAGQVVLLPLIALALVRCLTPPPYVVHGMLLVAACPAGSLANVYAYLARANVALAVTLTAVSNVVAVLTTPLLVAAGPAYLGEAAPFTIPALTIGGQLVLMLLLPLLAGMAVRRAYPEATERYRRLVFGVGLGALAALIGLVIAQAASSRGRASWPSARPGPEGRWPCRCATPDPGSTPGSSGRSSTPSSPPRPVAWGSAWRSAGRSSRRTAAGSGPSRTPATAPPSISPSPPRARHRHDGRRLRRLRRR